MIVITASCPRHGSVRCRPEDVDLYLVDDEIRYSFPCAGCASRVHKPADWNDVPVLAAAGIELAGDRRPAADRPFNLVDLAAFRSLLQDHDCLVALLPS